MIVDKGTAAFIITVVGIVVFALGMSALTGGCGHTFSGDVMLLKPSPAAPARLVVDIDADEVLDAHATGPASIEVVCPVGSAPGYIDRRVACVGEE